jgi:N-acetylglucosaminyldiphosphoundecaprenol N-acetyl-beta-D-mannosaminyltransferase
VVRDRVDIAGVPVDCVDMDTAVALITDAARQGVHSQVSTVNLDFLVNAQRDPDVRAILETNALNVVDGSPVVWLARLAGGAVKERVAGADLVPLLVGAAARAGLRVFLLGGEDGVASMAAARLVERYPELVVGAYEPPRAALGEMDDDAILERIRSFRPHLLFVAFGHPKQEKWIVQHRSELPLVAIGVGCSLDLVAGRRTRAPRVLQRLGLEWAYRLAREPGRLAGRYLDDAVWLARAVPMVAGQRARRTPQPGAQIMPLRPGQRTTRSLPARMDASASLTPPRATASSNMGR